MNHTLTLLLILGCSSTLAQQAVLPHVQHKDGYRVPPILMPHGGDRGDAFYQETFDSDLNGWTVETTDGAVDWKWTDSGPGPTSSTYPVPVLNTSTPSGWAIIDDDFEGTPGVATNSALISPVIDLSSAPANLKVEFDQYFQEFQQDRTFVGVSTDGGATWEEVEINIGVGRDGRPNPELMDVDISAWVAADPSNVQLRFRYESVWDYGWQVDNIAIRELPANDMALLRTANTAFDFTTTAFSFMDYSIYPESQLASLDPSAVMRNKGSDTQTGVQLEFTVDGPGGQEVNTASTPASFSPGEEVSVDIAPFTPSGALGDYTLTYRAVQDQADELPDNNVTVSRIAVSSNVFAHDDGTVENFQVQAPGNENEGFEVGSYFVLSSATFLTAIQVAIHEDTPAGGSVYGAVYLPAANDAEHPDLLELSNTVTIAEEDLNPIGGSTFITIPFPTPVLLDADQPYLVMAGSFDGPENIHFATSGTSAPQVSNIHYPTLATDFQFFITRTPMVRMVIASDVSVNELQEDGIGLGAFEPNPATERTRIPFSLSSASDALLHLQDASGRVVLVRDLGRLPAGEHQALLDVEALAPGVYTCLLQAGELCSSRRLVVSR